MLLFKPCLFITRGKTQDNSTNIINLVASTWNDLPDFSSSVSDIQD